MENHIPVIIFDYVGARGSAEAKKKAKKGDKEPAKGEVRRWRDGLQIDQKGQLDQKLDSLVTAGADLMAELITGPLSIKGKGKFPHIYKLQIGGKIRLRPLLCKGTKNLDTELTLLTGATERDGAFDPLNAPEKATSRRKEILQDDTFRQLYVFP